MFTSMTTACLEFQHNKTPKRKLNVKLLAIKCRATKEIKIDLSNKDASLKYGLPKNAISTWVKNKDKYFQSLEARGTGKFKKLRESDFDKLDHVVVCWFISKRIFL